MKYEKMLSIRVQNVKMLYLFYLLSYIKTRLAT